MSVRCVVDEVILQTFADDRSVGFHIDVMDDTLNCCKFLAANMEVTLEALVASMIVNSAEHYTNAIYGERGLSGNSN